MGVDKAFISYHGKPQWYHVYEMLDKHCLKTLISCNAAQSHQIDASYNIMEDQAIYRGKGPATGVLTAFSIYPKNNFLVIACDYPWLTESEVAHFLNSIPAKSIAGAFYDEQERSYQPVLAWYSAEAGAKLRQSPQTPLKYLLKDLDAYQHRPVNAKSIRGVDTKDEFTNLNL